MLSRRTFLRSGTLTALSLTLAVGTGRLAFGQSLKRSRPALDFQVPDQTRQVPLFYYTQSAFESYLGSTFTTMGARGGVVSLTLVSVTGYKPSPKTRLMTTNARASECFSLSFNASGKLPAFTTIHTLSHDALGKIDLFLTERKTESGGIFYEAVINHAGAPAAVPIVPKDPAFRKHESPRLLRPESPL